MKFLKIINLFPAALFTLMLVMAVSCNSKAPSLSPLNNFSNRNGSFFFQGINTVLQKSYSSALVSWSPYPGAVAYELYNVTSGSPTYITTINAPAVSYLVTGLTLNNSYSFRLKAKFVDGTIDNNRHDVGVFIATVPSLWLLQLGVDTSPYIADGTNAYDECLSVFVDAGGNSYCAGYTMGHLGEINGGSADAFVLKRDSFGTIQCITQLGNSTKGFAAGNNSNADMCYGVTADNSGNVYCAGTTNGALGENNGGNDDAFVMKLNSSGTVQWVTQLGGTTKAFVGANNSQNDKCQGVAVDSSGNVYCAGLTFGSIGETNGGSFDAFVLKLNSSGTVQWVKQLGATSLMGNSFAFERCNGVSVDNSGNVYCAGSTEGPMGEANGGQQDAFVLKLNTSGALQWVKQLGATTLPGSSSQTDICNDVTTDSSGNVYCAGETNGSLGEANGGSNDAFVLKLNSAGVIQWIKQLGSITYPGGDSSQWDTCKGVSVDSAGNVYCAGSTSGPLGESNGGNNDAFVLKLNSSGAIHWLTQLGAITGLNNSAYDVCNDVSIDNSGNVYCGGMTNGSLGETNGGDADVFMLKLSASGSLF